MTREEFEKYRQPMPLAFMRLPLPIGNDQREDEYGIYSTGFFRYKGKDILVANEHGRWHLSVSCNHPIGYYELKDVRYKFMPNSMHVAQIFPPREEFVNIHENCYHLFEIEL
jgi:hypothetical protein